MPPYVPPKGWQGPCAILYLFPSCISFSSNVCFAWMRTFFPLKSTDDISRVRLSVQTHSADDYINANYMPVSRERFSAHWLVGVIFRAPLSVPLTLNMCGFPFLGLPFQERFHCHTRTFTQHFEGFLAYGLGEKCICHCHADQMCWAGKGKHLLKIIYY